MPRARTVRLPSGTPVIVNRPAVSETAPRARARDRHLNALEGLVHQPTGHPADDPPGGLRLDRGGDREQGEDRKENPPSHQSFLRRA